MYITIEQACTLWDELRDAMEGKASHGHKAEIYAYTLMCYIPTIEMKTINHSVDYIRAAKSLVAMIDMFLERNQDFYALIEGIDYHSWLDKVGATFTHRVKVEIIER